MGRYNDREENIQHTQIVEEPPRESAMVMIKLINLVHLVIVFQTSDLVAVVLRDQHLTSMLFPLLSTPSIAIPTLPTCDNGASTKDVVS